jgi:DNA-binding NtrC family response regulator
MEERSGNPRARVLVVDDDPLIRGSLHELLKGWGYAVEMASDGAAAMEHSRRRTFDVVITDWRMPNTDGIVLLEYLHRQQPQVPVIVMTGFGNVNSAVEAMRQGAFDYLTKPIQPDELGATLTRALSRGLPWRDSLDDPFAGVVAEDPSMQKVLGMVRSVAQTASTVLLEGESGTGKRVIAQAIHRADLRRRNQPFVEVSCGALPETLLESELFGHVRGSFTGAIRDKQGRFEVADGGTILLDEIDAFSKALQVKLLRVIQDRLYERVGEARTMKVDVRIIAATNRRLKDLVAQGKFREDLYYRLNVIAIRLPALRERPQDLPALVKHIVERNVRQSEKALTGLTDSAMSILQRYEWPGNIRELENVLERAVILAQHSKIEVQDLPDELVQPKTDGARTAESPRTPEAVLAPEPVALKDALRLPERELILKVLNEVRWNRSEAAKRLGIHRSTLYQKIRQLGIQT